MSKEQIFQMNGLLAILVGVVMVVFNSAAAVVQLPAQLIIYRTFSTPILLVFVFSGFYTYQVSRAGILGLTGYVITVVSLVLNVCFRFAEAFIGPILLEEYPDAIAAVVQGPYSTIQQITFGLFLLGYVCFGFATLRAGLLPKWGAYLLIAGSLISYLLMMLPINFGAIISGAAFVWWGYAQISDQRTQAVLFTGKQVAER